MDEKLQRSILGRMREIEIAMFQNPPKTMEEFNRRWGAHHELNELFIQLKEEAKGLEDDSP